MPKLTLSSLSSGVPAWRSASWTPYGGATIRNQKERDEAKRLKLGTEASHHETAPTKRDLTEDV